MDALDGAAPHVAALAREADLFARVAARALWTKAWARGGRGGGGSAEDGLDTSPLGVSDRACYPGASTADKPSKKDRRCPHPAAGAAAVPARPLCLQPLTLRGVTLTNRVIRAAAFGGASIDDLIRTHTEVARGGVAMTTVAYAAVSPTARTFSNQLVLCSNAVPQLQRLTDAVHAAGAKIAVQLTHAGAFADRAVTGEQQVAPSVVFNPAGFDFAREMTARDLSDVKGEFASAAAVADTAGFDAVELHCGHGYLLSQFLTPFSNRRRDGYGGPLASSRVRFPLEVLEAVRVAVGPGVPVLVKMNVTDGLPAPGHGIMLADAIEFARAFAAGGADALVLSGGTVSRSGFEMLRGEVPMADMARAMRGGGGSGGGGIGGGDSSSDGGIPIGSSGSSGSSRNMGDNGSNSGGSDNSSGSSGGAKPGSWLKAAALICFGWAYVPQKSFEEAYFRAESRAVLSAVGRTVPVVLVGGVTRASTVEAAIGEGFACVQMARALIRQPDFVRRVELAVVVAAAAAAAAATCSHSVSQPSAVGERGSPSASWGAVDGPAAGAAVADAVSPQHAHSDAAAASAANAAEDVASPCTHCNQCVVSTLDSTRPVECVERLRDAW